jgi:hypothetical protein
MNPLNPKRGSPRTFFGTLGRTRQVCSDVADALENEATLQDILGHIEDHAGSSEGVSREKKTEVYMKLEQRNFELFQSGESRFRTIKYQSASRCSVKSALRYIDNGPGKL